MEKVIADKFEDLDVETKIKLILQYITALRGGVLNTGKMLENMDVNVAMKKAYNKLEQLMGIE